MDSSVHDHDQGDEALYIDSHDEIEVLQEDYVAENCPIITTGMEFKSLEEARLAYLTYAKYKGFGVRSFSTITSRIDKNLLIGKAFVCEKEGKKLINKEDEIKGVKRRRDTRTGCPARIRFCLNQSTGIWRVNTFDDNHNHECVTPSRVENIRSHRQYHRSTVIKNLISDLHGGGISNSEIAKVVNITSGSDDPIVTSQQCHDQLREERKKYIGHECVSVIKQFQEKMKKDPKFWFSMDVDENDNTLKSLFWADGRSRKSYLEFSDIIVFDVTYRTNKYQMPFAPFTGVNHHRQSTLFGCALIINEKEETFKWLFKEWLKCMFNVEPKVIITDQDPAICAAIKEVFPRTKHRYCEWHFKKHAIEHLGLLHPSNSEFAKDYSDWYYSDSIEKSDLLWKTLTEKYDKEKLKWLINMYKKRQHWVPVYWRNVFTAGMTSSQRSESMNAFFDGFINASTPLNEFTLQYDKALKSRRRLEKDEDHATMTSKPKCESGLLWQKQAAEAYTRRMYNKFYEQFAASQSYYKKKINKDGNLAQYKVGKDDIDIIKWRSISYDSSCCKFTCSCAMFETEGMLCRHIMAIFRLKQIRIIPDAYILRRWTIKARYCVDIDSFISPNQSSSSTTITPLMLFLLQAKHHKFMKRVSSSIDDYKKYELWLNTQLAESNESNLITPANIGSNQACIESTSNDVVVSVGDPKQVVLTKGRPRSASRLKSGIEISREAKELRQNRCSFCNEKGHNIKTCETHINCSKK